MSKLIPVEITGLETPLVLTSQGPAVSSAEVAGLETDLGFPLPTDYREFLLRYNGGSPLVGVVDGRDDDANTPYAYGDAVDYFYQLPTSAGKVSEHHLLNVKKIGHLGLPPHVLPIGEDGGGNCFVLELNTTSGRIRFFSHEHYDEPYESHRIVANSFLDLLLRIRPVAVQQALDEAQRVAERQALATGQLPAKLEKQCAAVSTRAPEIRGWIRILSLRIFDAKGHFSIHDDEHSFALLDLAFWLYENARPEKRITQYTEMATIVMSWWQEEEGFFGLTGYAPDFLKDWWKNRVQMGVLVGDTGAAKLSDQTSAGLLEKWARLPRYQS